MPDVTQESPEASGGFSLHPDVLHESSLDSLALNGIVYQERMLNCKSGSVTWSWMLPDIPVTL